MASSWLDNHLETFVRPYLGYIPSVNHKKRYITRITPHELDALFLLWDEAKRVCGQRTMLLPGRDVWEFEILARLDNYPTVFRPEISSRTKHLVKEPLRDCFLVDSGSRGSIPIALGVEHWSLVQYSDGYPDRHLHQLNPLKAVDAPSHLFSHTYNFLETGPKYWTRGQPTRAIGTDWSSSGQLPITQSFSHPTVFRQAAESTMVIARAYMRTKKTSHLPKQPCSVGGRFL